MACRHAFFKLIFVFTLLTCAIASAASVPPDQGRRQQFHRPWTPAGHHQHVDRPGPTRRGRSSPPSAATRPAVCKTTPCPQLCTHILLSSSSPKAPLNSQAATVSSFALTLTSSAYRLTSHLARLPPPRSAPKTYSGALQDCMDLMSNTMDQLKLSISRLSDLNTGRSSAYAMRAKVMDAQVSLSASFTFEDTCSDELHQHSATAPAAIAPLMKQVADATCAVTVAMSLADALQHRVST